MAPSFWQIALVVLLGVLLFGGRGRISSIMGDLAKGLTAFRKGLKDDEDAASTDGTPRGLASDEGEKAEAAQETREKTGV